MHNADWGEASNRGVPRLHHQQNPVGGGGRGGYLGVVEIDDWHTLEHDFSWRRTLSQSA